MTNHEVNKFNMYRAVITVLKKNEKKFVEVKALQNYYAELVEIIAQIEVKNTEYLNSVSGKTLNKTYNSTALLDLIIPIKDAVHAYAIDKNNAEFIDKFSIANNEVKKMRSTELIHWAKSSYSLIKQNNMDFSEYGISDKILESFLESITNFENSNDDKDDSFSSKKNIREILSDLFNDADELISKIKKLMSMQKILNPDFYLSFSNAVLVKDLGNSRQQRVSEPESKTEEKVEI